MPTYETLVRDHHALAFKVARSILRDDSAAEDAVQDVYLHFIKNPGALSGAENLRAFVARAAVNRALDLKRGAGRREQHERASLSGRADMNPVEAASRAELRAKVAELPEEQRLAIEMHYFHGLTKEETAHALQVASGTVSSRLNTALGRLRTALAGAAFVGVLAMLESELSKCSAESTVPETLAGRLLRLTNPGALPATPASPVASAISSKRVAAGVAATAAALFLALVSARLIQSRHADAAAPPAEIAALGEARQPAPPAPGRSSADSSTPAHPSPVADIDGVPVSEEIVLEGFLFRRDEGLFIEEVRSDDYMPKQTMWHQEAEEEKAWRKSLTLPADGALAGLPAGTVSSFGRFMLKNGDAAESPQVRIKVRVRGAKRPASDGKSEAATKMIAPSFAPQRVELVAVLEKEVLSPAWLNAWREMQRAGADLWPAMALEPGADKRTRVLEAATRLGQAWERARAARAGESSADWRIRRESESSASALQQLRGVGLDRLLPSWPAADEIHEVLMNASSTDDLRKTLASRWNEDALRLGTWCYRAHTSGDGGFSWGQVSIPEILAMDSTAFSALKKELESIAENRTTPAEGAGMEERRRTERARVAAEGLVVADLSSMDRERFIIDFGARVVSIAAGSAAEKAGLRVGDILWKAVVMLDGKGGKRTEAVQINGESGLALWLTSADNQGAEGLTLQVVREDGVTTLELGK